MENRLCKLLSDRYSRVRIYFFVKNMKRILLKLSGEAIKAQSASNYDPDFMDMLAQKIIGLTQKGMQVGIVVG